MKVIAICLLWLTIMTLLAGLLYPIHIDEGVFLAIGKAVSRGSLPYRDVFDQKTPGLYYLLSTAIHLFGNKLWWTRWLIVTVNVLSGVVLYRIASRWLPQFWSLLTVIVFLIYVPIYQGQFVLTEPFMVLFGLMSFYELFIWKDKQSNQQLFLSGFIVGIAVMFKQAAVGYILSQMVLIIYWSQVKTGVKRCEQLLIYGLGIGVVFSSVSIYFIVKGSFVELINATTWFLIRDYGGTNPLSQLKAIFLLWLPLIIPIGIVGWSLKQAPNLPKDLIETSLLTLGLSLPLLLFRPYHHYILQVLPFIALIAVSASKLGKNILYILLFNTFFMGTMVILYSIIVQYPLRLDQLNTMDTVNCQNGAQPVIYYLNECSVPYMLVEY